MGFFVVEYFLAQCIALDHHSWNVERAFEQVTLDHLCRRAVTMEISKSFSTLFIREMGVCPIADLLVHVKVFFISGC